MKKMLILGIVAAMACASAAYAYPSLAGITGNGVLPTAAVVPAGQFNAALDYYNTNSDGLKSTYPLRVVYGVMDGLEVGAGYTMVKTDGDDVNAWNIDAKYVLPFKELAGFSLAAGARYGSTSGGAKIKATDLYVAATRAFDLSELKLDATLGVNWEKLSGDVDQSGIRFFVGLGTTLANKLSLAAEFQTKKENMDAKALWDVVARYPFTDMFSGEIGYGNYFGTGFIGANKSNLFVGVNATFGGKAAE